MRRAIILLYDVKLLLIQDLNLDCRGQNPVSCRLDE
ncbi:hypothetical protein [Mycobacterium phage PP]|uniref:Uncharacterized protein n=1 Tax=Mycobacterium phage PP TaxID=2077134 RepID=A0A2Z5XVE8_9CAUD|nr:hypothetical protein KIW36_gp80 [Mycobacterium phage PP]BBC53811.1 hypothetical protein [Mycobacterium phage PP]